MKKITRINKKGISELKNPLYIARAISILHRYEETGISPAEVMNLIEENRNLIDRMKKFEEW